MFVKESGALIVPRLSFIRVVPKQPNTEVSSQHYYLNIFLFVKNN